MASIQCKCKVCDIDFWVYSDKPRDICNMCGTKGPATKEAICKLCGKPFVLHRNPKDGNKFEKKIVCPGCANPHCRVCGCLITRKEAKENGFTCFECTRKRQEFFVGDDGKNYSFCSKCKKQIEVDPETHFPTGHVRKLCKECYSEFLAETKEIQCVRCGKSFVIGRSPVDGGWLQKDNCPECYQKFVAKPEFKIRVCEYCHKEFKIYQNADGRFTEHKKYCPDCEYDNPLIKAKHKETCRTKYGVDYSCLLPQCQTARELAIPSVSLINMDFSVLLDKNGIRYVMEWPDMKNRRHYDFYLYDLDILIEINPSYTHSVLGNVYEGYELTEKQVTRKKWQHLNRSQDVDKRVIHIWDWDDWDKVIELIKPDKTKLYARKLRLGYVEDKDLVKVFLNQNHLQGNCRNKNVSLGLFDKQTGDLMQVMVFGKPRYNKNYEWELLRLCTRNGFSVIGGAERIFSYFVYDQNPKSIISYCDYSKFTGDVYLKLGFEFVKLNYPSKIWSKGKERITDSLLRQRGFDQLFHTNYGKGTSNKELMLQNHWLPVFDCGQKVFVWKDDDEVEEEA